MFAIAAVAGVLLNRKAMLTRDQAITEVLYPGGNPAPAIPMTPPGHRPDQGIQEVR